MDEMKQRILDVVSASLSGAPDSDARTELIEELTDNLYRRYEELLAAGTNPEDAFARAMDDLGDTSELVEYLKGLAPDEGLPHQSAAPEEPPRDDGGWPGRDELNDLLDSVSEALQSAMGQAGEVLRQASDAIRNTRLHVDFNPNDQRSYGFGYDRDQGGFYARSSGPFSGAGAPAGETPEDGGTAGNGGIWFDEDGDCYVVDDRNRSLRGVNIETVNGDVTVHRIEEGAPVQVGGDVAQLDVRVTGDGMLLIRQGKTASSSFFFLRGLSSADVELYLPRRAWEFLQVSAVNGDVNLGEGLAVGNLAVKTSSGNLSGELERCGQLTFKSSSGDVELSGLTGHARAETMSGDVTLSGDLREAQLSSVSGDVELTGAAQAARLSSVSGDVALRVSNLPERADLSSKSGDCSLVIPDQAPFTVLYRTTSGDFDSDFPLRHTNRGALYGDGGARAFSLSTISGDMEVRRA